MTPAALRLVRALAAAVLDAGYDLKGCRERVRLALAELEAEIGRALNRQANRENPQ
jgi:hypothetical protein